MKKIFEISLGVVTSVGGFLEMGSLSTAAQGGAAFGLQLVWPIVVGTLCIIFLTEMAGRFAAVSQHTIAAGIRDRFGIKFFLLPFVAVLIVNTLVLSAEIGGVSVALEMATGLKHPWWALPVALLAWFTLWRGTFGLIEKGVSLLGLVTLSFVAAAVTLKPDWHQVAAGVLPSVPHHDRANYWFIVVSILGASITPSLFLFYSSGAVEDQWDSGYLGANRAIATLGMTFGGCISLAVLVAAAYVFSAHGITRVDDYHQLPLLLVAVFGFWGFVLFIASLAFACLGAILQIALEQAYLFAQGFGWNWGENRKPRGRSGVLPRLHVRARDQCDPDRRGRRPAQTDRVLDGADSGKPAAHRRSVSGADERRGLCGTPPQRRDFQYGGRRDHRARLRAGDRRAAVTGIGRRMMDIVRDVLDKQVVDRHSVRMGRVDGIVAELRPGRPPEVIAIEIGSVAIARRVGERTARWVARLAAKIGGARHAEPYRIAWSRIRLMEVDIEVDIDIDINDTPLDDWQRWLREHVVERLPRWLQ
jgi:Mn2+/Fe2+ NRAMP family transporter